MAHRFRLSSIHRATEYLKSFSKISILGLLLDVFIFNLLIFFQLAAVFEASVLSIFCALVFVYFSTAYKVFSLESTFLFGKFLIYVGYQVLMILVISASLEYVHSLHLPVLSHPVVLKLLPLPFTFVCNAMVSFLLLRK